MLTHSLVILAAQIAVILIAARALGALASLLKQPRVIGEMLAGIVLGPTFLGWAAPSISSAIFRPDQLPWLNGMAQAGVIVFLFLIGLELDLKQLRQHGRVALLISNASIIVPFLLGAALTFILHQRLFADTPTTRFMPVALFMGAAMSVTAFPVLARILSERNMLTGKVGTLAITCAAVDDVSAWCMLAFISAIGGPTGLLTLGLAVIYVILMLAVVRLLLRPLDALNTWRGGRSKAVLLLSLVLMSVSAFITNAIGIHALFGAFLMGAIMPRTPAFTQNIIHRLHTITTALLLPLFFAYAGLKTRIGLLNSTELWALTGLIVAVACAGKFGGSAIAARFAGLTWRESTAIGILMNTRGLMELVILTAGLQMGFINETVFAMMMLMALITTATTTPILCLIYPRPDLSTVATDEHAIASA